MRTLTKAHGFRAGGTVSLLLAIAVVITGAELPRADYTFRTIARTGQSAANVTFDAYLQPGAVNNAGEVSFAPGLTTGGESVFLATRSGLAKVAAAGESLPGGLTFGYTLGPIGMTQLGDTAFISTDLTVPTPLGLDAGVFRTAFGIPVPVPVMLPGQTVAPGGKRFYGAAFNAEINNRGEVVFPGIVCSGAPLKPPSPACQTGRLAFGIYQADSLGHITAVVEPGSPAPGGSTFDYAQVPFNNNAGDVAFDAHVFSDPCNDSQGQQGSRIFCEESVYLKNGRSGAIVSVAHQGQDSPVLGQKYNLAFGPVLNEAGDLVFIGNLSGSGENGVFLYSQGTTTVIAKPGGDMPGGGVLKRAGGLPHTAYLNNSGAVAFIATLTNGDHGLYFWKNGALTLVAKTGMEVDGGGVIANLNDFGFADGSASSQVAINDNGQILFAAKLTTGPGALLLATPR
jgi:hypothetical protein